jgi:hypothetical protein
MDNDYQNLQRRYSYKEIPWSDIGRMASVIFPFILTVLFTLFFAAQYLVIFSDDWPSDSLTNNLFNLARIFLILVTPIFLGIVGIRALFRSSRNFVDKVYYSPPNQANRLQIISKRIRQRLLGVIPLPQPFNELARYPWVLVQPSVIREKGAEFRPADHWTTWWGGPSNLEVMDGTGVYAERGGRFSRIIGPGFAHLDRHEIIREIVDLRPQTRTGKIRAWTKDSIEVTLDIRIICRVGLEENRDGNERQIYPCDPDAVRRAVERTAVRWDREKNKLVEANWLEGVWGQLPGVVSSYVSSRVLDELFFAEGGNDLFLPVLVRDELDRRGGDQTLSTQVVTALLIEINRHVQSYGARVSDLQITGHFLPDAVTQQRVSFWESRWQNYIRRTSGETKANQIRTHEQAIANAQRDLLFAISETLGKIDHEDLADSLYLTLTTILDKSLDDPTMRSYMAEEAVKTLEKLQQLLKKTG